MRWDWDQIYFLTERLLLKNKINDMNFFKSVLITVCFFAVASKIFSQDKFFTKSGKVQFDATTSTSPEKVAAVTNALICVVDTKSGAIQFSVVMKSFEFKNALMQEHFNENYVESNKFPKADFKGTILNNNDINYTKEGTNKVKVKGQLTIHGISKEIETEGLLNIKGGKINATASFPVILKDFDISVPSLVADKVANNAKINIDCSLEPLK